MVNEEQYVKFEVKTTLKTNYELLL